MVGGGRLGARLGAARGATIPKPQRVPNLALGLGSCLSVAEARAAHPLECRIERVLLDAQHVQARRADVAADAVAMHRSRTRQRLEHQHAGRAGQTRRCIQGFALCSHD